MHSNGMHITMNIEKIKGFTLIELIVGTAIIMSLLGFGTASYVGFNERQLVDQTTKTLKNNLRLAQQNALSGVKDISAGSKCTPMGVEIPLSGWCVSPNADPIDPTVSRSYYIYGVCDDGLGGSAKVFPANPTAITIPNGVVLEVRSRSGSDPWVSQSERARFNVLGQGVTLSEASYTELGYCIRGTLPSIQSTHYRIRVSKNGEIFDDGFVTTCF